MNRRAAERYTLDLPCGLSIGGEMRTARISDLSDGGAGVAGAPGLSLGTRGTLHADAIRFALPFTVRSDDGSMVHLAFVLDAATAESFRGTAARLAQRQAA